MNKGFKGLCDAISPSGSFGYNNFTMKPSQNFIKQAQTFVLDLLPRAGQVVRSFFHSEKLGRQAKQFRDFTTDADLASDETISDALRAKYPRIPILTEETCRQADLSEFSRQKLLWIVDPLDGTANFSRGDSNFSISIALVSSGRPLLGAIFVPISGRLFWAKAYSKNAYWNGRTIHVSPVTELSQAVVCTDWSHLLPTRKQTTAFLNRVYRQIRQVKILGSAATDLTLLARGGVDIYHHVKLFPWDTAAAGLICQKAGATVTQTDGSPWNAFSPSILAANPALHRKIINL